MCVGVECSRRVEPAKLELLRKDLEAIGFFEWIQWCVYCERVFNGMVVGCLLWIGYNSIIEDWVIFIEYSIEHNRMMVE